MRPVVDAVFGLLLVATIALAGQPEPTPTAAPSPELAQALSEKHEQFDEVLRKLTLINEELGRQQAERLRREAKSRGQ